LNEISSHFVSFRTGIFRFTKLSQLPIWNSPSVLTALFPKQSFWYTVIKMCTDFRVIIYSRNMFIIQATGLLCLFEFATRRAGFQSKYQLKIKSVIIFQTHSFKLFGHFSTGKVSIGCRDKQHDDIWHNHTLYHG